MTRESCRSLPALRACPRCGSSEPKGFSVRGGMVAVECSRCGYRGGEVGASMGMREREEEVVRRWNRSAWAP